MVKKSSLHEQKSEAKHIPPVVTVLGHVDHGKTTLLDVIRKTSIAEREHGSITQKIGASSVEIEHEGQKRSITFIDTPGHEAFKLMRGRGLQAADLALLVVSSVDGVMPQTKESIQLLRASKTPFIVVLTKSDVPDKNIDKVKGQLLKEDVLLEGKGGEVPVIEVSAKTNENIKELLDLILLVFDLSTGSRQVSSEFKGIVIESKLDPKAGPKGTIVVKGGKMHLRDEISADSVKGKVRSILNTFGKTLASVSTGEAVEILGFEKVPSVGSIVQSALRSLRQFENSSNASTPAGSSQSSVALGARSRQGRGSSEQFSHAKAPRAQEDLLKVILVADTQGSLEAIENSLSDKVSIVLSKTGNVEGSDILFAKSTGSVVLVFNAKVKPDVQKLAESEKVLVRNYTLIYEMLSEVEDFLQGKAEALVEKILGRAQILASFPYDKQKVLGVKVLEGRIAKGDRVRLVRGKENIIGESTISSLRAGKEQVSKVEAGQEAGILLSNFLDFNLGDMLISHS